MSIVIGDDELLSIHNV